MSKIQVRNARAEDAGRMIELIQELADYEKSGSEVSLVESDIIADGFCDSPAFKAILAIQNNNTVGMALLYDRYSTWKGRTLYLEDLIVTHDSRGQGIGQRLLQECIGIAKTGGYKRLEWQVLDWNKPAIEFYQKMDVEMDGSWINCRMRF